MPPDEQSGDTRRITTEHHSRTLTLSVGPLPPADELEHYNKVFPGCAERIISMAERQSEHRQHLEKQVVEANCSNERRGQIFAFVLSLIAFGAGVFLLATDKAGWGTGLIGGDALAVIGLFIYGRESQKKERQAKERQQQEHIASAARRYPRLNRRR